MKRTLILILSIMVLLLTVAFCLTSCDKETRSIERTEIINGELVVFYNDGTSENLGKVVQDVGVAETRSIERTEIINGELVVFYNDGTSENLGKIVQDVGVVKTTELEYYELPDGTLGVGVGGGKILESIEIPKTYLGKTVTKIIPNGFEGATNLKEIIIPDSVTGVGNYAFYGCTSLTSIVIPDSVTSIGNSAFRDCTGLTSITIPNSVTSIGITAFENCPIENATIPTIAISYVRNIYLKTVVINGGTSIGNSAFRDCTGLTSVTIPDSVISIGGWAFDSCTSLTSVNYLGTVAQWCNISFGNYYANPLYYAKNLYINSELVTSLVIPNTVTEIKDNAFSGCTSLTSIVIPDSVTSIGERAFSGCTSLTIYCEAASQPEGWDPSWRSSGSSVVWNCNNNDTANDGYIYTIIDGVRYGIINNEATVVRQSSSIKEAIIPNIITYQEKAYPATAIGNSAFYGCTGLTSVTIGDSVTSIGNSAFYGCKGLTSVTIPDSVTTIGNNAFAYCTGLTSATIPDSVTSIGNDAFDSCTSLTTIVIPDSVTSIGNDAFDSCIFLTIYCEAESAPSGWDSSWNPSRRPVVWGYKE